MKRDRARCARLEDRLDGASATRMTRCWSACAPGAKFSMPGMMETVLNVGLNDASVLGLAEASGDERFAWDSYRRLIQMFGKTVLDIDGELFSDALDARKARRASRPTSTSRRRTSRTWSQRTRTWCVSTRDGLPAAPARAARPGHPGGLRLVEHRPCPASTAGGSGSRTTSAPR